MINMAAIYIYYNYINDGEFNILGLVGTLEITTTSTILINTILDSERNDDSGMYWIYVRLSK